MLHGLLGDTPLVYDPLNTPLNLNHVLGRLNGMLGDQCVIYDALEKKNLMEGNETPLGTVLRMIEAWPPVVKAEAPAEVDLKPGMLQKRAPSNKGKAASLAELIALFTRVLMDMTDEHRMNNGLYPEPIRLQMDELRDQRLKLVDALVACDS